jgi:hypothetical protein
MGGTTMEKYTSKIKMVIGQNYLFPVKNELGKIKYQEGKILGSGKTSDDIYFVETTVGNYTNKYIIKTSGYVEEISPSKVGKVEEVDDSKKGKVEEVEESLAGKLEEVY